jgi:hypothetical protein
MTDFRALCVELHAAFQLYTGQNPAAAGIPANELVARLMDAMANTAAALAQPEPQGPTGRPAIEPVPVSERLPEPDDCDGEGRCWWWYPPRAGNAPTYGYWAHEDDATDRAHHEWPAAWLPHRALPVPGVEGEQ